MFVATEFAVSSNMFAFIQGSMEVGHSYRGTDEKHYYFSGYWLSDNKNTKGALSLGAAHFKFSESAAAGDGLFTYGGLSELEVLKYADTASKDNQKEIRKYANALFGNKSVYSQNSVEDVEFKVLVDSWFDLPNAPAVTYGWMKRVRN